MLSRSLDVPHNATEHQIKIALQNYICKMEFPAGVSNTAEVRLSKYGESLELTLFSRVTKKIVWILQSNCDSTKSSFSWTTSNSFLKMNYDAARNHSDYATFLYLRYPENSVQNH